MSIFAIKDMDKELIKWLNIIEILKVSRTNKYYNGLVKRNELYKEYQQMDKTIIKSNYRNMNIFYMLIFQDMFNKKLINLVKYYFELHKPYIWIYEDAYDDNNELTKWLIAQKYRMVSKNLSIDGITHSPYYYFYLSAYTIIISYDIKYKNIDDIIEIKYRKN